MGGHRTGLRGRVIPKNLFIISKRYKHHQRGYFPSPKVIEMDYIATKRIRKIGKSTMAVSLDKKWGFEEGDLVVITVRKADDRVTNQG